MRSFFQVTHFITQVDELLLYVTYQSEEDMSLFTFLHFVLLPCVYIYYVDTYIWIYSHVINSLAIIKIIALIRYFSRKVIFLLLLGAKISGQYDYCTRTLSTFLCLQEVCFIDSIKRFQIVRLSIFCAFFRYLIIHHLIKTGWHLRFRYHAQWF